MAGLMIFLNRKQGKNFSTSLIALFAVCLFVLVSCPDDIQLAERIKLPEIELEEGKGVLSIHIDEPSSRTILPQNTDWSSFTGDFRIEISGLTPILRGINNLSAPIVLDAGNYSVTVTALRDGTTPIARGEINITVTVGEPAAHIIRLSAIIDAGTGTFNWNVTIPTASSGQLRITQAGDGTQVGGIETLAAGANTGNRNLNSGYYFITTTLSRTNYADIIRRDVLHVYQNMTSVFTIEFTDALFNSNVHNVIFDHGYGSLSDSIPVIHGEKAMRPANPTRTGYDFIDWYTDAALTTLYDFDTPVSMGITLYAGWELLGTVTVTVGTTTTWHLTLDAAFNSIATAGNYTVTIFADQTLGARTLNTAGVNVTLVSSETGAANERTIQYNGAANDYMFFMTGGVSLTLGNNITLVGLSGGTMQLLYVQNGTLTMNNGSKITGHTTSRDVIVTEGANSRFVMSGGIITGNTTTWTGGSDLSGGVLINSGATATITGGSITGNSPVDLYINSATIFNLSGNAAIGNIRLNASSAISNANITLDAFTGTVGTLNLRSENAVMDTIINWWLNKQVIQAASGHTLTTTDIAKFTPGSFISSNVAATQAIGPNYSIGTEGTQLGRLVSKYGSGTAADPFLIYDEDDLRAVGRGATRYGAIWSLSAHYRLMADIDLTGRPDWTRIGGMTDATGFTGTFNGNGKTITGMTTAASSTTHQGMFGYLSAGSVVRNLGLADVNIRGSTNNVGGFAGLNFGIIENCFVTGSINGTSTGIDVGGISGSNGGTIQNCYVIADITGRDDSGGITGWASGGTIRNCYIAGTITGGAVRSTYGLGGIVGTNQATVQNTITLLQSITVTSGTTYNKIAGFSGSLMNNRAWRGTVLSPEKAITSSLTDVNGLDVTAAVLRTQATWQNAATTGAAFSFGTTDASPWVWENGKMPRLYWETIGRDWPSYLIDPPTGAGTTTDPFLIYNETDLRAVGNGTYNGMNWSLSAHYRLVNNITLTSINWTPIGTDANRFTGSFNGDSKTISNLTITATTNNQGMFGVIDVGGAVRNLGLLNMNITITGTGITHAGGIAGMNGGVVENCHTTGLITGVRRVGGVVGQNGLENQAGPGAVVRLSHSTATVTASEIVAGGVVGRNVFYGVIENCYSRGNVTANLAGTDVRAGGIAGYSGNGSDVSVGGSIRFCYATGNVSTPNATGTGWAGGIAGDFTRSTAEGNVALNSIITGVPGNRIFGTLHANSVASNNFARSGMLVNGAAVTTGTGAATVHGENVAAGAWNSVQWWRDRGFTAAAWPESRLPLTLP